MKKAAYTKTKLRKTIDGYMASDGVKSTAGLRLYLGVCGDDVARWEADGEYGKLVEYAKSRIEKDVVENGLRGKYNAAMSSFILRSTFGYRDRGEKTDGGTVKVEVAKELCNYAV